MIRMLIIHLLREISFTWTYKLYLWDISICGSLRKNGPAVTLTNITNGSVLIPASISIKRFCNLPIGSENFAVTFIPHLFRSPCSSMPGQLLNSVLPDWYQNDGGTKVKIFTGFFALFLLGGATGGFNVEGGVRDLVLFTMSGSESSLTWVCCRMVSTTLSVTWSTGASFRPEMSRVRLLFCFSFSGYLEMNHEGHQRRWINKTAPL